MEAPLRGLQGGSGDLLALAVGQGLGVGGDAVAAPPFPHPCIPPPIPKNGEGGMQGGEWGKGGADSVLVCLRQTRDASPPTEGTVKAVRQPPRLWIFFFTLAAEAKKQQAGGGAAGSSSCAAARQPGRAGFLRPIYFNILEPWRKPAGFFHLLNEKKKTKFV
nr:hypothetical protein [Morchella crassipes]